MARADKGRETMTDLTNWANSHETDERVAEAIFFLARSETEAERIWQDPTEAEWLAIWQRATQNGQLDGTELNWGEEVLGNEYAA
jgi:hypothetical protein